MNSKIVKFIIKRTKQVILLLIIILLALLILNIFTKAMSPAIGHNNETSKLLKKKSTKSPRSKNEINLFSSNEKPKPVRLKDLFRLSCNLPSNKKFNLPFVSTRQYKAIRQNSYARPVYNTKGIIVPKTHNRLNSYAANFTKDIRARQSPDASGLSVLFVANKTALITIGDKKYYVHSGMNIKGNHIISISVYGLNYSYNGKIKHLSVN